MRQATDSFERARQRLALHDNLVDHWRRWVRPRCENHVQMGFWERTRHVWRGDDMCPQCRGKYTHTGYPAYSGNMLSDVLQVTYGPAITKELNRPTAIFDVCQRMDEKAGIVYYNVPKALEVV